VSVTLSVGEKTAVLDFTYDEKTNTVVCAAISLEAGSRACISILTGGALPSNDIGSPIFNAIMSGACLSINDSRALHTIATKNTSVPSRMSEIMSRPGNEYLKGFICEVLSAY